MEINKVVVLSAVLLSSIAGAMEEKVFNPSKLGTLCASTIASNPDRAKNETIQFCAEFCRSRVTEICKNPKLPLDEKIPAIAFWADQTRTDEGFEQIKAVQGILEKRKYYRDNPTPHYVDIDSVDFIDLFSIDLDDLFYQAIVSGNFKPHLAQFVINQAGSQIAQNKNYIDLATRYSKEPSKSVQFLLNNNVNPQEIKRKVWDALYGLREETVTSLDITKEILEIAKRLYPSKIYAAPKEYEKTIKILEKAEQAELNETYSGISRLFEEN